MKIMFKDEFDESYLSECLNRFIKWEWHDEYGNKIVDRNEHNKNVEQTKDNFHTRILKENLEAYNSGKSPVNPPKLFDNCSMSDFTGDKYEKDFLHNMYERAREKESFWLAGTFGSGKSRFMWAYAKHLFLEMGHRDLILIRFSDIFKHVKMDYGTFVYDDYFKRMMTVNVLLVDDIKVMTGRNANQYEAFVDLLDSRIENNLTTCFSSNVNFSQLAGDEESSRRIATRVERILKNKKNIVVMREKWYDF